MKTMKKLFCFLFLFFTAFSFNSLCQIRVFSNNYVGINFSTTPSSRFVINAAGNSAYQAWIYNPNISTTGAALAAISEKGSGNSTHIMSMLGQTSIGSANFLYGIKGSACSTTTYTVGRTYGVYGIAGNGATGYNYGVYGYLSGTQYGAAVFGTINGLGDLALTQQYAGYFRGDVKVENILWASDIRPSDLKFKTNIVSLEPIETLGNILKINPVKYNLKQVEITQTAGDTISITKYYNESDQLFTKVKYGVIAQDLQNIYPDLVYKDGDGNLGVDYTGLIPIMIKAIQVQQKKIEDLEMVVSSLKKQ